MNLQKTTLIIFILTLSNWTFNQNSDTVSYSLVFKDCCNEKIKTYGTIYLDWYVVDDLNIKYVPQNNTVRLEKEKQYFLYNEGYGILNRPISLDDTFNVDTIITSCLKIVYPNEFYTFNPIYLSCEDTLNGHYHEYYDNGSIRLKGYFINGRIKDSLLYFYSNGQLKSMSTIVNSDSIYKSYYPNGQISHVFNWTKRSTTDYFEDGSVKGKNSYSKMKSFKRYSKDQLWYRIRKRKQVAFYRNGHLKYKLKRKPLFFIDRVIPWKKSRNFIYKWIAFDTTGTKAKEIIYYSPESVRLYSTELHQALNNFSHLTYYKNGKKIVSFFAQIYNGEHYSLPVMYFMTYYENGSYKYSRDLLPLEFETIVSKYESNYELLTLPQKK